MKPLDLTTLVYIIAAISLLFAVLMLLFHRITPSIKGPIFWSLGSFSAVISSFLFAAFPTVNGFIAFVISSGFTTLTVCLYWAGIRAFKELPINYWIIGGLVFTQLFLSAIFYFVFPMPNIRMVIFSVISALTCLLPINELLKPISKPYRFAFVLCAIVFFISIATSLFRISVIVITQPGLAHAPTSANLLFYFFINITQALLLFSFVLMISTKIAEGLKSQVETQQKFFSIIAHDLNGPIGSMAQLLELANNDKDLNEEQRWGMYHEVEKLSLSTYHLLHNLLFWSKNQLEDMNPVIRNFDLNQMIYENIELFRQISSTKKIEIVNESEPNVICKGDIRMIESVIRNLLSNAIKFTRPGGQVTIGCCNLGDNVQLRIVDNGVGMSPEIQKQLFKRRNGTTSITGTSGEKGSGLGLFLCKEFVGINQGSIHLSSIENEGTEVLVTLKSGYQMPS